MRLVFMGTGSAACPVLARLARVGEDRVEAVITQPDRAKGRRLRTSPSPVKQMAVQLGMRVITPARINEPESVATLAGLAPDVIVVVAYGQILGPEVLSVPPRGCLNVHASLLPALRGAAPVQWAIARGYKVTGVTVMFMDEGMDTGDIVMQREAPIGEEDTALSLSETLARMGAELLVESLQQVRNGTVQRRPQGRAGISHAPKLRKEDGRIDWTTSAVGIRNRVRAFIPWPCCTCGVEGRTGQGGESLRVLKARVEPGLGRPGEVLDVKGDGPLVATGEGALRLLEVQPAGGRAMRGTAYLHGHKIKTGTVLL